MEFYDETDEYQSGFVRPIDGALVKTVDDQYPPLAAVVIDNHPNARPAFGLAEAPLVYEVPVEGLFTRYLAFWPLYPDNALATPTTTYYGGTIGPVRSARPYMLDVVAEYDAVYAHVGGSPQALDELKTQDNILDLNEFSKGWYFWRHKSRYAPHNVMTTLDKLAQAHEEQFEDHEESVINGWGFLNELFAEYEEVRDAWTVQIDWAESANIVEWEFDAVTEQYRRFRGGRKHVDIDGEQVVAGTVIVQHVDFSVIDDYGRLDVDMIGSGDAVVYRDGQAFPVIWQKPTRTARTQWRAADGKTVPMKSGAPVWVHVVPTGVDVQEYTPEDLLD